MKNKTLICMLVFAAFFGLRSAPTVLSQGRPDSGPPQAGDKLLAALLEEMRQLRIILQRTNVISHRLQITLERIRLQQARIDSIVLNSEGVRARLGDLRAARPQMDEQIRYAEDLLTRTTEANRRAELEQQMMEMKSRLGMWTREEEQLRNREAELGSELQTEQVKLSDLHNQLDRLVRELEGP